MSTIRNTVIGAAMFYLVLRISIRTRQDQQAEATRLTVNLLEKLRTSH